jgi:hypothetical protein
VKLIKNAHTASAATASRPVGGLHHFFLSDFILRAVTAGQMAQLSYPKYYFIWPTARHSAQSQYTAVASYSA